MLIILIGLIDIIGTIFSVLFVENGYVTLGIMTSINCFFFIITIGIITSGIDELQYKMMTLERKLDYIIEREYESSIER